MLTRDEFIWKIDHGDDIMFDVRGRHYAIFTWDDDGIRIIEQNKSEAGQKFKTSEELVDEFVVDGLYLNDVVSEIKITNYTLVKE